MLAQLYFNAEAYIGKPMYAECEKIVQDIIDQKFGAYSLDKTWFGPHTFKTMNLQKLFGQFHLNLINWNIIVIIIISITITLENILMEMQMDGTVLI